MMLRHRYLTARGSQVSDNDNNNNNNNVITANQFLISGQYPLSLWHLPEGPSEVLNCQCKYIFKASLISLDPVLISPDTLVFITLLESLSPASQLQAHLLSSSMPGSCQTMR